MKKILKTFQTNCIPLKNCTTRPKRTENENTYTFLKKEEMLKALFDGSLIECQEYNGWYYGILESSINIFLYVIVVAGKPVKNCCNIG